MSHTYPIAKSAKAALESTGEPARTRYEAEALAQGRMVASLETEWLTPASDDVAAIMELVKTNPAHGFVQHYEDATGNIVLAVTFWKLAKLSTAKPKPAPVQKARGDHTDDLYFRSGRTKPSKRKRFIDPDQLDMFGQPDETEA